jgi:hypothetical protein
MSDQADSSAHPSQRPNRRKGTGCASFQCPIKHCEKYEQEQRAAIRADATEGKGFEKSDEEESRWAQRQTSIETARRHKAEGLSLKIGEEGRPHS